MLLISSCNSLIPRDVTAAILVERTMANESWESDQVIVQNVWNQHDRLITQVQLKNYDFMLQRMVFYNYIALKEVIVNSENTIAFIH